MLAEGLKVSLAFKNCSFTAAFSLLVWWSTEHLNSKHQQLCLDKSHFTLEKAQAQTMCPFASQSDAEAEPIVHFELNCGRNNK